jgi:UDP-glucose 4-epimerase
LRKSGLGIRLHDVAACMTIARKKIVITGASGNVGTGVLRALAAALPNADIVGICRRPPTVGPAHASVSWHRVDLSTCSAFRDLEPAMQGADIVIHLALALRPASNEDYLYRVNVAGTQAVLDAMAAAGVGQLIYASSLGVYSPGATDPVTESWPRAGQSTSVYSRHKIAAEKLVDEFAQAHPEVAVARFRPTLVVQREAAWEVRTLYLGPLVPRAVLKLLRRRVLPVVPLPAGIALQFVHADDVGEAVVRLLQTRATGSFNLAADILDAHALAGLIGGRPLTVSPRLVRGIVTALHAIHAVAVTPGWYDVAMNSPTMDTACAREELGWRPTRSSTESAMELIDGLARGSVGASAAMGATEDDRTDLRRAADQIHDSSLLLWSMATVLRAVGVGRAGVIDAAFVVANLIAGTPAALDRLRTRRRDPVAILAPIAVVAAVASTIRGGWPSVATVAVLNLFAEAEQRRTTTPLEQHDSCGFEAAHAEGSK